MTTQVEKAVPQPVAEPQPHASPSKSKSFNDEMLSPVSKLELARKFAAEEQERRVAAACERMVVAKKAQIVKKMEIEAHLDTHIEQQYQQEEKRGGRLSTITRRLVDAFKATAEEDSVASIHNEDGDDDATSPTRKLLQATRTKLTALASKNEDEDALPATNYHLKQLGLANEKINIYAPLHEQQNEIRRRRESAIRCQEKYMQDNAEYPVDDGYKSAEDSDFAPDEGEEESDSDSDDDESEDDIDDDELRALLADQSEFKQSVATLKKHKRQSKKAKKTALSPISIVGAIVALLLAIVVAVFVAEQQSGFCRALVAQEPRAEESRIATCSAVLQLQDVVVRFLRLVTLQ